jgi:ADP-ribose pyrophosphatase
MTVLMVMEYSRTQYSQAIPEPQLPTERISVRNALSSNVRIHRTGASMVLAPIKQPNKKAKILKSEVIYEGKAFGVRRDDLIEPTGVRTIREVVTHPGSVVLLPILPDGRIILVRQYRHAARQYLWELVAGRMERGENVKKGAQRELREETGYRAKKLSVFLDFFPTPGFLEEQMFLLLAEGLTAGVAEPEDDEKIIVAAYTRKQLGQMIRTRKLRDAKSIAGLLFYFSFLAKNGTLEKK